MQKKFISCVAFALALAGAPLLHGQPAYFQAVTNLNPIGYWPLNETAQPPAPFAASIVASNSGTLGATGNGYYGVWYQPSSNTWYLTNNVLQTNFTSEPLMGETGLSCNFSTGSGQYVVVPRTIAGVPNTNVTIVPPMSVEAWFVPHTVASGVYNVISEGSANVDYGGPDPANPFWGGLNSPGWAGFFLGQYQNFFAWNYYMTNGQAKTSELDSPKVLTVNTWYHVVVTFDGNSQIMYLNGVQVSSNTHAKNNAGLTYVPDLTTPLMIASGDDVTAQGGGGGLEEYGIEAEVAVYNQVLSPDSILNHYMAGYGTNSSGSPVTYTSVIEGDSPILYYRLNEPQFLTNAGYASTNFPVATNYGSLGASANGVYQPGSTPGVAGPSFVGFGSSKAVALNGFLGAVDVGGGSLPSALNPVGTVPFTVVAWFQGNSADAPARFQDIVGHGSSSYRLFLGENAGENRFNPGASSTIELGYANAPDMVTNNASKNDGHWHMVAGVTDGTNAYMYLDGVLARSTTVGTGINIVGSSVDLLLGGDPTYTYASYNSGSTDRTFDGQIAQVAMWNTNLSAGQIQTLFNAAGVPPSFVTQPVGATNNQGTTLSIGAVVSGSQPINYQWWNTNGTRVAGQTNLQLAFNPVTTNQIGSYYLVATSSYGSATSSVVQIFVYGAPVITSESQTNLQIFAGQSPVLLLSVAGASPISYQWYSNSVLIPSATSNTYTISGAQTSASYTAVVSNSAGMLTAGPFTVTVVPAPTAPYPAQVLADHPLAFWRLDETSGTTAYDYVSGYNGIYTNVQLDAFGSYHLDSDPSEVAPQFGNVPVVTNNSYVGWIPTNLNFVTPTNVNGEFSVECWLLEQIVMNDAGIVSLGYGNGGEEFAMDVGGNDPAHDLRFYVRDAAGPAFGAVSSFSPYTDAAWHHVVGVCDEASGKVLLYIDGTNAATPAAIPVKGGILNAVQSLAIGARQEGFGTQYDNQFFGAISQVAVYNYALTPAQVQTHYFASGIAPAVNPTPSQETTNLGATATFSAGATGTAPLTIQWYDPNNHLISTNATLTLSNVQQSAGGQYVVVASNPYGSATGYVYLTVVLGPPQITQDISPLEQTVQLYSGLDNLSYYVIVGGTAPFSYQWYQNGLAVANATNSSYTFTALAGTNTYYVTVTNSYTASQGGGVPAQSSTATVIGVPCRSSIRRTSPTGLGSHSRVIPGCR